MHYKLFDMKLPSGSGTAVNTVAVSHDSVDPVPGNNTATMETTFTAFIRMFLPTLYKP